MPRITFRTHDGARRSVDAPVGSSVMEAARDHGVPGIDADCGGACACATCHVFVDPSWYERTGGRSDMEEDLLGMADNATATSRLSCQIRLDAMLDGLVVDVPVAQH